MFQSESYKKRLIEKSFDEYMKVFGAVCLEGPKYCGKTWTASSRAHSVIEIGSPKNNFQNRTMAKMDPNSVLDGKCPRLIDEWQEVPPLWDAIRFRVDQLGKKGQFILTGSSTPNHKGILHSGTGRISKIRMNTMSLYETGDSSGVISLKELFDGNRFFIKTEDVPLERLIYYTVRGGWPGNLETSEKLCGKLATNYLKAVVEEDMFKVDGIKRDSKKVWSLLHSLGRNESTIVNLNTIKKDMETHKDEVIDRNTATEYLNIFNRLFILDDQPAFSTNLRSSRRVLKNPKRHFVDPSLAVAALGATQEKLFNDLNTFGFIFESLCEHDLKIYAEYNDANLFHFRDERGNEVDAVVELNDGTWGAFEIKLGANQIDSAAENLLKIKSIMEKEGDNPPKFLCVICGLSGIAYRRDDGVYVVPITMLKP